jgi:hypothetical protein
MYVSSCKSRRISRRHVIDLFQTSILGPHVSLGFQASSCASRRYFPSFFQNQTVHSRQFPFLQHFHQLLRAGGGKGTGRPAAVLANMSARVGSIGDNQIGGWHSYRASKTALNQRKSRCQIKFRRSGLSRWTANKIFPGVCFPLI